MNENEISELARKGADHIQHCATIALLFKYTNDQSRELLESAVMKIISDVVKSRDAEIERLNKSMIVLREQNYCSMCGVVFDELRARIGISDDAVSEGDTK